MGAGPAVVAVILLVGAVGVQHHSYPGMHAWRQAYPLHYLVVHLWCAVGSGVQCSAGVRRGGEGGPAVVLTPCRRGPVAIHRHWGGRWVSHAAHTSRQSSQSGAGHRALGPRGSSGCAEGSRTRLTPVTAVTSCVRRKVCTPPRSVGAGREGRGTGAASYRWVGVTPRDPLRGPAGRDDEEEQGGAQVVLPEDLPPVVRTPAPGEGGGQVRPGPAAGCVRRWWEGGSPSGLSGERLAHDGVRGGVPDAVVHQVGRAGAGGRLVRAFQEHRDFAHLQILLRRM